MKLLTIIPEQAVVGSGVSDRVPIYGYHMFSVQFSWTGTVLGVVSLEHSVNGETWDSITGSEQSTAGTAGSHMITYSLAGFPYFRAKYVHTSGSGNIKAMATIK